MLYYDYIRLSFEYDASKRGGDARIIGLTPHSMSYWDIVKLLF